MMYLLRFPCCIAPALAFLLAGCSIQPLPDNHPLNFPRASTFDIVQRVRCEAKAGLDHLRSSQRYLRNSEHKDHVEKIIKATSVGYDFQFTITEENQLTEGALTFFGKPANPASERSLRVDFTGKKAERTRLNKRTFRIIEELADVANMKDADCFPEARANLAYPISGRLRVDELVRTYIGLERISDLDDPVEFGHPGTISTPVFSEHLEFKTTLTAGARPTLTLSAAAGSFRLTNATVRAKATRTDEHSLIIAFAQAAGFKDDEFNKKAKKRKEARGERKHLLGKRVVRSAREETALAQASSEHARNRLALELARLRNLLDDEEEEPRFLGERLLKFLRPLDETGPGGDQP